MAEEQLAMSDHSSDCAVVEEPIQPTSPEPVVPSAVVPPVVPSAELVDEVPVREKKLAEDSARGMKATQERRAKIRAECKEAERRVEASKRQREVAKSSVSVGRSKADKADGFTKSRLVGLTSVPVGLLGVDKPSSHVSFNLQICCFSRVKIVSIEC